MKKIIIPALISLISISGCTQWFVNSLTSKTVASIKSGDGPGQIQIVRDEYSLNDLSFRIEVHKNKIITADNNLKRLQILDGNPVPELIIGSLQSIDKNKYKTVNFNFNIIGCMTMDDDNNIYVQNRLLTKSSLGGDQEGANFSPSYILVFNENGELQYTMGKTGTPDIPFFYIEKLFIDSDDRLFVLSRTFNTWELFRFNKKKREKYIDFSKLDFKETENKDVYNGKIENIVILKSGEEVVISVAYYHDVRFKYRKIYEFSLEKDKIVREITSIQDPKNVLFNIVDDKILYFWNIEGKEIKFMLVNMDGNIINNIKVEFDNNNIFSKIIHDENGTIYSYHIYDDTMKIFEWK
ncbi:MAG TPA: hypothetical protein PKG60_10720 [Spirochaetota bacterium]|nr:hypothetical protein [Spirochaetota bacterium]HPS85422.1 hypothetical protein [Spirochaetota bacterium]